MMMFASDFVKLSNVEQFCEFVKMEHRLVLAVFAKESNVLAQIHIFEVIRDKTSVAALNALAKFF